jgi:hypothetical protein
MITGKLLFLKKNEGNICRGGVEGSYSEADYRITPERL